MINTKIYKAVYELAEKLMRAADKEDREAFDSLYAELKAICIENENTDKDHPEQWETLADFTEELDDALVGYEKALFPWLNCKWSWAKRRRQFKACKMPRPALIKCMMTSLKPRLMSCL